MVESGKTFLKQENAMQHHRISVNFTEFLKDKLSHDKMDSSPARDGWVTTSTTVKPEHRECDFYTERQCDDGSCISKVDLCSDEQIMNQNTILIMIVVGMAVVIFLIILYCFQQRQRESNRASMRRDQSEAGETDGDNASLYQPPPTYDEVITTNLYPPTPQLLRQTRMSSSEEPPMTPPPNYDIALNILAQSHESILVDKKDRVSPVVRRSVSVDQAVSLSHANTPNSFPLNENVFFNSDSTEK